MMCYDHLWSLKLVAVEATGTISSVVLYAYLLLFA